MVWTLHFIVGTAYALSNLMNGAGTTFTQTVKVDKQCKDLNFCTVKPDGYPQELFNKILKGKIKEPVSQPMYLVTNNHAVQPKTMASCEVTVTYEPLYNVRTGDGIWHTVVQAPEENYEQLVRIEVCKDIGSSCFRNFRKPVEFQRPFCKQKYGTWEFLVHDGKYSTKKVKADLPVCCVCQYHNEG